MCGEKVLLELLSVDALWKKNFDQIGAVLLNRQCLTAARVFSKIRKTFVDNDKTLNCHEKFLLRPLMAADFSQSRKRIEIIYNSWTKLSRLCGCGGEREKFNFEFYAFLISTFIPIQLPRLPQFDQYKCSNSINGSVNSSDSVYIFALFTATGVARKSDAAKTKNHSSLYEKLIGFLNYKSP